MTTAGCHMTGALQVGVAAGIPGAKRKGGSVGVRKVFRNQSPGNQDFLYVKQKSHCSYNIESSESFKSWWFGTTVS